MQVHVSPKHKSLVVPPVEAIANLYPQAPRITHLGNNYIVLPHGLGETVILRNLGFTVPSPVVSQYSYPGATPFEVQRKTCDLLTTNRAAYVLNDMGTGKTRAALWAWHYLRSNGLCGKLLVVAPLSTLNFTWGREIWNTLGADVKYQILHHNKREKRIERLADKDAEIYIINHDGIKLLYDELIVRKDIDVVVIDELATYRNGTAQRTKIMRKLAASMGWKWGMTGSPIPTGPCDAWAEASIITPHTVPSRYTHFRDAVMTKVAPFKYVPRNDAVDRAYKALQPAVRFTLDDVVELPECVERFVDVEMGPQQRKIYKELVTHCHAAHASGQITAANAGAAMMKLLQVACGWVYTSNGSVAELDNNKRIEALVDAINSTSRKVLVFSPFKHMLDGISKVLTSEVIDHETVDGSTSMNKRSEIFNIFQNTDKLRVLNAHPQCLAHGITLTRADTIIWAGPVTSLEIYEQANRRIRRVGQKHKQLVLHLQATPVEKRIYALLHSHQLVQNQLLDMFKEATV